MQVTTIITTMEDIMEDVMVITEDIITVVENSYPFILIIFMLFIEKIYIST